jgi:S1-C subfamily serine protease
MIRLLGLLMAIGWISSCATPPAADPKVPGPEIRRHVAQRAGAVIVTDRSNLDHWVSQGFTGQRSPGDADGGSSTPIAPDGYFLTADHVLASMKGRNVFVLYGKDGHLIPTKARVVWRSESGDLALMKIPVKTPNYYRWTAPDRWLPVGTPVIHGGISTGFKSAPGKLNTSIAPEGGFRRIRKFKLDIPLQPGDSGGPVVDAYGGLVGINSAVEFFVPMETAFFVDSEATRPDSRSIEALMQADRARNITSSADVE